MKALESDRWPRRGSVALALMAMLGGGFPLAAHSAGIGVGLGQYDRHRSHDDGGLVQCESVDNRPRSCSTGGGDVRLLRQLSDAPCIEGRSWGVDRGGVWVSRGCRAQFAVSHGRDHWRRDRDGWGRRDHWRDGAGGWDGGAVRTLRCESGDNQPRECLADTRGGVRLTRRLSRSSCDQGQDWGYTRDYVWVSNGCRAEFALGGGDHGGWGDRGGWGGNGRMIQCESIDNRQNHCGARVRYGVRLQRQLSGTRCVEGRNWGWDRGGIWVGGGCRAQFIVD